MKLYTLTKFSSLHSCSRIREKENLWDLRVILAIYKLMKICYIIAGCIPLLCYQTICVHRY